MRNEKGGETMDQAKLEGELGRILQSLDKGVHLEEILEEEGGWAAVVSKGVNSDRVHLSRELLEALLEKGEREKEVHKALGKVIGKLNRAAQKRQ